VAEILLAIIDDHSLREIYKMWETRFVIEDISLLFPSVLDDKYSR